MRIVVIPSIVTVAAFLVAADPPPSAQPSAGQAHAHGHDGPVEKTPVVRPDEKHLKNVTQLTFGGENAEAYFDQTGKELIFQTKRGDASCDAIFRMTWDGKDQRQVSPAGETGGRTTCSYIRPDGKIIYSSTHGHGGGCLDEPDRSKGYVWKIYPEMDIWVADADGKNAKVLFESPGYDAEATICHKDGRIIFTSSKDNDLELYVMDKDGKNIKRLTNTPGYDGGAFFSEDCSKIVWRASRPTGEALADFQKLLGEHLVRPTQLEIFVADIDAKNNVTNVVQVTKNGKANFAPYLHPDNKRVLFASNQGDPKGRDFDIYMINVDGTGQEKITTNPSFDGFPMFSPDGKKLVFASNRNGSTMGETNVFIADWVE
jgi:Tol biopolymer transport system component